MELANLLSEKKEEIIKEWFDLAVQAYPPDTAKFLKDKTNRFANPVGYNFSVAMEAVIGHLLDDKYDGDVVGSLEGLVKIKAVQDFSASQAVRFIFLLKRILRKHAGDQFELHSGNTQATSLNCFWIWKIRWTSLLWCVLTCT
jgi:hypothetical protein